MGEVVGEAKASTQDQDVGARRGEIILGNYLEK